MSVNNEALRQGIIEKLKEYDAYIDNELPDYIMVMLANRKTIHQVNHDLRLFLGDNTDRFTDWLQKALISPETAMEEKKIEYTDQSESVDKVERRSVGDHTVETRGGNEMRPNPSVVIGTKRKRGGEKEDSESENESVPVSSKGIGEQKSGRVQESRRKGLVEEAKVALRLARRTGKTEELGNSNRDLREFIAQRKEQREESQLVDGSGGRAGEGAEDDRRRSSGVSSVVKMVHRSRQSGKSRPSGRLLQKAILGISQVESKRIKQAQERRATKVVQESNTVSTGSDAEVDDKVDEMCVDEFREEQQIEVEKVDSAEEGKCEEGHEKELSHEDMVKVKAVVEAVKKVVTNVLPSSRAVDLREYLNQSKETSDSNTRFVVTLNGLGDKYQYVDPSEDPEYEEQPLVAEEEEVEERDEIEEVGVLGKDEEGGLTERCRFWPNCKNGDSCPFHHPSAPCRLFPNCKYGNKCLFVHPNCKFDARCMRPDCPYLHTAPRHLLNPKAPVAPPPVMFSHTRPMMKSYSFSRGAHVQTGSPSWNRHSQFPTKSSLTWTPSKSQQLTSDRKFAVPEDETTFSPT